MPAMAVPVLQLDISNGTYDASAGEESTITSENVFDLFALGKESSNNFSIDDVFHISAALTPKTGFSNPADDFGSFNISYTDATGVVHVDETIAVTADMTFGIPPLEANWHAAHDGGDLGSHDIFDTYFYEFSFKFDAGSTIGSYNTQDGAHSAGDLLLETFRSATICILISTIPRSRIAVILTSTTLHRFHTMRAQAGQLCLRQPPGCCSYWG